MKSIFKKIISLAGNVIFIFRKKDIVRSEIKKVLIVSLYFKGDVLMNTPALRLLNDFIPEAQIDIWVKSRSADMIKDNPRINKVIIFDNIKTADYQDSSKFYFKEKLNFLKKIRKEKYDLCIDLTGKYTTALFTLTGGFRYSIGLNYNGFGFCYSKPTGIDTQHSAGHLTEKYLEIIKQGLEISEKEFENYSNNFTNGSLLKNEICVSEYSQITSKKILSDNGILFNEKYIVIQPAAGWKAKQWSGEKYSDLISELSKNYKIVLIGSEADAALNSLIKENSGAGERCISLSVPMEISSGIIAGSALFIGSDSAGLQTGGALEIPTVGIFGPTNPGFSNPPGDMHLIVYNKLDCSASESEQYCTRNAGKTCQDIQCIKRICVNDVLKKVNLLLKTETKNILEIAG